MAAPAGPVLAQGQPPGAVLVPDTSIEHLEDVGVRAHTNHLILFGPQAVGTSPSGETPQSIRSVYNLPSTGGSHVIAIVDAFDYPTAENDLNVFSSQFGLPPCTTANGCFEVVYASGTKPRKNCGWSQEAALDIEWAHAMAPGAKIVLVEAASNSFANLFAAVDVASSLVQQGGGGQVSMSWGGSEFSSEASDDFHMGTAGVVYFASSGDTGGATIYPGVSPNVVSAGGTSINRDRSGNFVSETGWSGSGGGPSKYEARPSYQDGIATIVGSQRGAPFPTPPPKSCRRRPPPPGDARRLPRKQATRLAAVAHARRRSAPLKLSAGRPVQHHADRPGRRPRQRFLDHDEPPVWRNVVPTVSSQSILTLKQSQWRLEVETRPALDRHGHQLCS